MSSVSRRGFAALLSGGLFATSRGAAAQTPPPTATATFAIIDFFGQEPRAWEAVEGYPDAQYNFLAGSAASASTRRIPGDLGLKPVTRATWQLIWTAPGAQAAVELAHIDPGFLNYTQFAELRPRVVQAPDIQYVDVTAAVNSVIAQRRIKYLVCRARGDGQAGSLIYGSSIELVWS